MKKATIIKTRPKRAKIRVFRAAWDFWLVLLMLVGVSHMRKRKPIPSSGTRFMAILPVVHARIGADSIRVLAKFCLCASHLDFTKS